MNFISFDHKLIRLSDKFSLSLMRIAIAIVYVWFGGLKLFNMTPADQLVSAMQARTLPFISDQTFLIMLGLFEVTIGLLFLFPKLTRLAILFLVLHMMTTFLPLIFLPHLTWVGLLQPTLIGQYILKNIIILALALAIGSQLKPMKKGR